MIVDDLVTGLKANESILRQFVESMSEAEIRRRIRDYWTIYEHVEHLALTQMVLLKRIELFIAEENPTIVPFTPDSKSQEAPGEKPIASLVEKFCAYREKQIASIRAADEHVWGKIGKHENYSSYSFEILIRHILLHDGFHMYRMEELWIMKERYIKELDSN